MEIWQSGFSDHRIRDVQDYENHVEYINRNPVGRRLVEVIEDYLYCSTFPGSQKDEVPQWLKPRQTGQPYGAAEAATFRQQQGSRDAEATPLQELETETVAIR
jgi:hypothetical protein